MIRKEAISIVVKKIGNNPIISADGFISRDLCEMGDKATNFYMIGSMGLASSIGLGVALKNPKKRIYVFDGDGNILMNLGSLVTIGSVKPKNFVHIIFDNSSHESTGGQPSNSRNVQLEAIAKSANYSTFKTDSKTKLKRVLDKIKKMHGPILILVKVRRSKKVSKRVSIDAEKIKIRFMNSL